MKKFPVKYSVFINVLLIFITLILCAVIVYNVIRMIDTGFNAYNVTLSAIFIAIAGVLLIYLCSIAFFSRYKLNDDTLFVFVGLFPFKIDLRKIDKIIKYSEKQEVIIKYLKNNNRKTHLVCMDSKYRQNFIDELLLLNPKISYIIED